MSDAGASVIGLASSSTAPTPTRRDRRHGSPLGIPADSQHPAEEAIDALRGAVRTVFPEGRLDPAQFLRQHNLQTGRLR
jgi:hypothetical protein